MSLAADILAFLVAQNFCDSDGSVTGWKACRGWVPPSPDHVVVVTIYPGDPPTAHYDRAGLNVHVRGGTRATESDEVALEHAERIRRALVINQPRDIGNSNVRWIEPTVSAWDELHRPAFSVNVTVTRGFPA
jgi:hypothetical protein